MLPADLETSTKPRTEEQNQEPEPPEMFIRFNKIQRIEHLLVMVFFTILVITGLPQKFFETTWAGWMIRCLGGIDSTRLIHRITGILFTLVACFHLGRILFLLIHKQIEPTIVPVLKDFRDAIHTLKYYLGISDQYPQFDRYDFRQKFEYFGLLIGGMVMIVTGLILYFPVFFTSFLPGVIIPSAKTAHSYEGFMAFLVIIIWHMYGAHFNPDVFPGDMSIFTGKISRERMQKEHPLEYARIMERLKKKA